MSWNSFLSNQDNDPMWGQFLPSSDSSSDNSDGVSVDSDASTVLLLPEIIITPPSPTDSEWEAMLREM
jgi:hypothetical protein